MLPLFHRKRGAKQTVFGVNCAVEMHDLEKACRHGEALNKSLLLRILAKNDLGPAKMKRRLVAVGGWAAVERDPNIVDLLLRQSGEGR